MHIGGEPSDQLVHVLLTYASHMHHICITYASLFNYTCDLTQQSEIAAAG